MISLRIIMLVSVVSLLSSCGGGGGKKTSIPTVPGASSSSNSSLSASIGSSQPGSSSSSSSQSTLPRATLSDCPTDNIPNKYKYSYRVIGTTLYYDQSPVPGVNGCDINIINEQFYSDSQFIYFERYKMPEADKASFVLLAETDLAKDKNNVYQYSTTSGIYPNIISRDAAHFVKINASYYKDSSKVYLSDGNLLLGADYSTLIAVTDNVAKDKIGFFYGSQRINFKSNNIIEYDDGYLNDGVNIYFYNRKTNIPAQEFIHIGYGLAKSNTTLYVNGNKANKAYDLHSIQTISESYIKDKNNIYVNPSRMVYPQANNIVAGADRATFQVVNFEDANHNTTSYAKDKNGIYFGNTLNTTLDLNTYETINTLYAKDKNNVYLFGSRKIHDADPATFALISNEDSYAKDKNKIFYYDNVLQGADVGTFEVLDNEYSRDKSSVYKGEYKIEGADPATFVIFSYELSKDKNNVYFNQTKVDGADAATMKYLSEGYYYDKNKFFNGNKIISGIDVSEPIIALGDALFKNKAGIFAGEGNGTNVDSLSFINLNNGFYKDSNKIYTSDLNVVTTDIAHFTVLGSNPSDYRYYVKDSSNVYYVDFGNVYKLTGADVNTFEVIADDYIRDATKVFLINTLPEQLVGLNPNTLQRLTGGIITDGNLFFWGSLALAGADPITFDASNYYAMDATHVYCGNSGVLSGVSTSGLSFLENKSYFKIATKLYYQCKEVVGADVTSLQEVGVFVRDSNHVYYGTIVYTWPSNIKADALTFEKVAGNNDFYKDKSHIYSSTNLVLNADVTTFEQISDEYQYFKDKDHIYFNTSILNADVATFVKLPGNNSYFKDKIHVFNGWGSIVENADPNTFDPDSPLN